MNAARGFQGILTLLSRSRIQNARTFATIHRTQRLPFLKLINRHLSRPSIRHQPVQRNFTTKTRLRDNASNSSGATVQPSKSVSQRLKDLSREYGWTAVGVYFALSALDFPFCFLAVRWIGTEKIAAVEHRVIEWVKRASPVQIPERYRFWKKTAVGDGIEQVEQKIYDHGYKQAELANRGEGASLGTQLALAYAIHKSFIFIRVPLTAAVLPKIVKTLRGWGWNIGKRKPKVDVKAVKPDPPTMG